MAAPCANERVGLALDVRRIQLAELDVEVEPSLVGDDVTAGHRGGDHARQQVQRGVQAHEAVAPWPVELERQRLTRFGERRTRCGYVQHPIRSVALAGVGDRQPFSAGTHQPAAVAGLAPAERIKQRAVELDAAFADRDHAGAGGLQVGIGPKKQFGHDRGGSGVG
ncbi:MAG: hypothetical protein ACHP9U_00950 [Steroidobacterales bacterium]